MCDVNIFKERLLDVVIEKLRQGEINILDHES